MRRDHDGAQPGHLVHECPVGRGRAGRVDQVGGHPHDLVGAHVLGARRVVPEPDLGEADPVRERLRRLVAHVGVGDREVETTERLRREGHGLAVARARRIVEVDGDRRAAVEPQLHLREVALRGPDQRLDQVELARGDRLVEIQPELFDR